jgi:predicted nuclease of predicted toxin-antitoxin system
MDAADIEIMAYAAKHDYVVLTHDLDFSAILAATQGTKPSVVQIRSDNLSPAAIEGTAHRGFATDDPGAGGRRAAHS